MNYDDVVKIVQDIISSARILKNQNTDQIEVPVNYVCIFCQNEDEYNELVTVVSAHGKVVKQTSTGPLFHINPLYTVAGILKLLKIRIPDDTRRERGDADFTVDNYQKFKMNYLDKENFILIEREDMEMIELRDDDHNTRCYFSHPTVEKLLEI